MASAKQQLIEEIKDLESALKSEYTPANLKDDLRSEIAKSKKQLEELEEAEKKAQSKKPSTQKEGESQKKSALQKVKERLQKTKATKKKVEKKQVQAKKDEKPATKRTPVKKAAPKKAKRVSSGNQRDASRKALKPGWRKSKETGEWYYESRSNRSDSQRKSFPYLEDGGTTDFVNDGAGTFAKGGIFGSKRNLARDRMFKSKEKWEQKYKRKTSPKNPRYKYAEGGATDFVNEGAGMFAKGGFVVTGWTKDSIYSKKELQESLKDAPVFYLTMYNNKGATILNKILKAYKIEVDVNKEWHTKGYGQEYIKGEDYDYPFVWVIDVRDASDPIGLMDDLWRAEREYQNGISVEASAKNIYEEKYAEGGATDFVNEGAGMFKSGGSTSSEKVYNVMYNVGKAKYLVNFHDGIKTHKDGSPFFDVNTFRNKVEFNNFIDKLESEGYKKVYAEGGTTDFVNEGAGMFEKGGYTGEAHRTESMYEFGGAIVDQSYGLLADPRFDVQSPIFSKGGKLSSKYNYLPKYKIATITTEDGAVIDGNDIIDGLYVKKKVKF